MAWFSSPDSEKTYYRRRAVAEEENALISLARDNDYGYIPPGYGLNDHLKATMASIAGPCGCLQQEPITVAESYAPIPSSYDPVARSRQRVIDLISCHHYYVKILAAQITTTLLKY